MSENKNLDCLQSIHKSNATGVVKMREFSLLVLHIYVKNHIDATSNNLNIKYFWNLAKAHPSFGSFLELHVFNVLGKPSLLDEDLKSEDVLTKFGYHEMLLNRELFEKQIMF